MKQKAHEVAPIRISRRRLLTGAASVLGIGAAGLLAGCTRPGKPEVVPSAEGVEPAVTVRAVDNKYLPADIEVEPGQAVRWVFEGMMEHDVVAEDGSFVSELMTAGSYTHVFDAAGEFPYDCSIHPEMTGIVRVVQA